jgi:hypothetical protein
MSLSSLRLTPALALLLVSGAAAAEPGRYYAEAPEASVRSGWNFGFGVGGGDISCGGPGCDGVTEAGSLDLEVGRMLRPRLRAVLDIWIMAHREDDLAVNQTIATAGLQYWIVNRLWLRGGIGTARAAFTYQGTLGDTADDDAQTVLGLAGGIGVEVLSRRTFALDVELRGGTGFYDDIRAHNAAFDVAVTWY